MISLLKPSSSSGSTGSTHTTSLKDGHRGSMVSRMGIGVDAKGSQSPPLAPQRDDLKAPGSPQLDDQAHSAGILIHHDRPPSFGQLDSVPPTLQRYSGTGGYASDSALSPPPTQTATLPISPALSTNAQLINSAQEKIPADQLPPTVRPGVPVRAASKIRFAPLPNPRRQRSLSTGRNIAITATMQSDGTRTLQRHARMDRDETGYFNPAEGPSARYLDEEAVDDEDLEDDDDGEDGDDGEGKGKKSSWKTMGMGNWKSGSFSSGSYTRKLLKPLLSPPNIGGGAGHPTDASLERSTSRESGKRPSADIVMPTSQSLRKTFSTTSGFIGSSPFRTAGEHERKRTFFPASTAQSGQTSATGHAMDLLGMGDKKAKQAHRASNTPNFSSLSASLGRQADTEFAPAAADVATSPRPVKMLNGRVYGKKRQPEADGKGAAEPEFVEWGGMMGQKGGGIGSVAAAAAPTTPAAGPGSSVGSVGKASADDDDDGSGMGWVKRRREQRERERRASEAALSDEPPSTAVYPDIQAHHVGSLPTSSELDKHWQRGDGVEHLPSVNEDRVATPIYTEHFPLPAVSAGRPDYPGDDGAEWNSPTLSQLGRLQALDLKHEHDEPGHIVQAVQIPGDADDAIRWRQSFQADDSEDEDVLRRESAIHAPQGEDEYEEEDAENDFESDDEEELAIEEEKKRQTSSAAGVEVVSRHRD